MTRAELWRIYTDKNPAFLGDDGQEPVTLRRRGLKKMSTRLTSKDFGPVLKSQQRRRVQKASLPCQSL